MVNLSHEQIFHDQSRKCFYKRIMHKQESDITSYIEPRRKEAFFRASLWPVGWGVMAERHKLAADHIYEIAYKANQRVHKRFLRRIFVGRILRFFLKREVASSSRNLKGRELSDRLDESLITDYLLLSGYSLECIFKGILMMENPKYVSESGGIKAQAIATHNLIRLANECLVSLSEEEEKTLASITQQVVWAKYPAPKKWTEMPSNLNPDDRNNAPYALQYPFHNRRVQNTVNVIYSKAAIRFALLKEEWRANQGKDR